MNKMQANRNAYLIQSFKQFGNLPESVTAPSTGHVSRTFPGVNPETDQTMYSTLVEFGFIDPVQRH